MRSMVVIQCDVVLGRGERQYNLAWGKCVSKWKTTECLLSHHNREATLAMLLWMMGRKPMRQER